MCHFYRHTENVFRFTRLLSISRWQFHRWKTFSPLHHSLRHRSEIGPDDFTTSRAHRNQVRFNGYEEEELLLWRLTFCARRTFMWFCWIVWNVIASLTRISIQIKLNIDTLLVNRMHIGVSWLCFALNMLLVTSAIHPMHASNVTLCNNEHKNQFSHSHAACSIRVRLKLNLAFNYVGHGLEPNERNDRTTNASRLPPLNFPSSQKQYPRVAQPTTTCLMANDIVHFVNK